jgi:hypothetical protein
VTSSGSNGPLQANKKHSFHNWRGKERREALSISGGELSMRGGPKMVSLETPTLKIPSNLIPVAHGVVIGQTIAHRIIVSSQIFLAMAKDA